MSPLVLVLLIVFGVALLQAAIWIPLLRKFKRDGAAFEARFATEAAASGETIIRGPEKGIYRGTTESTFGGVRGNGTIRLTSKRLLFRKLTGGVVEIPTADIKGTREAQVFMRSVAAGRMHLVVETKSGAEVAFFVGDNAAWARELGAVVREG